MPRIDATFQVLDESDATTVHLPGPPGQLTACGFVDVDHIQLDASEHKANCPACFKVVDYYRNMRLPDGSAPRRPRRKGIDAR